jgi:hypothetical protein
MVAPYDLASAYPNVRRKLESWNGYKEVTRVMAQCPDLQVFLAGGAVRSCLIEELLPIRDFDFFLAGPSIQRAVDILSQAGVVKSTPYGSPRWHPVDDPERYADLIPIADFKPGLWKCEDIIDVLNQFDYTASALAFDLRTGTSFDPQNGLRDLLRGTMRMVRFDFPEGPFMPDSVLTRNAILWFRVLHYAAVLDLVIEPLTLQWLRSHQHYRHQASNFCSVFFNLGDRYLDPL